MIPQNTLCATTSNDELGLAENEIAQPFEEEVHEAMCLNYLQVQAEAPQLMLRLCQVRDTLLLHWQALADISLSAIRKSENPPKY
jgi:hypothetical protein